jgi:hypothetical protein
MQAFEPAAYMESLDPFAFANRWTEDEEEQCWTSPPWTSEAQKIYNILQTQSKDPNFETKYKDQWTISHKFLACCVVYRGDRNNCIFSIYPKYLTVLVCYLSPPQIQINLPVLVRKDTLIIICVFHFH